jgi:nucleoside-diphosphate-sugar epimerase
MTIEKPVGRHRVAVTGVTGTLGRAVVNEFVARPNTSVLALMRATSRLAKELPEVAYERLDFQNASSVEQTLAAFKPTIVIHAAATGMQMPRPSWEELLRFNVETSVRLCEAAARLAGCHFVFISSGLAYRDQGRALREQDPLDTPNPYGASKAAADVLVRAVAAKEGVPLTIVRPFSFSGVGDVGSRLFPSLLRAAVRRRPLELSPGDQVRDHCAVQDIAQGIALAATRPLPAVSVPQVLNLGSGNTVCLKNLVEALVAELELQVDLQFGARNYAPAEPKFLVADISQARTALNWQPRINFAYAIWQLAQESFPDLKLKQPRAEILTTPQPL